VSDPVVATRNLTKRFEATTAVDRLSVDFDPGTVHALIGENGSGKSTLVKMLAGVHQPTDGEILIGGKTTSLASPRDAIARGIATIYQETALVPQLTALENIMLGQEQAALGLLRRRNARAARRWLDQLEAEVPDNVPVERLSIASRQMVAIAKALSRRPQLLILDEPTAALGRQESDHLFERILRLRDEGLAIIYITHRLFEVERLADTLTVLKDGIHVTTRTAAGMTEHDMANLMVGRELGSYFPDRPPTGEDIAFEATEIRSRDGQVKVDSFVAHRGEIVGIAGLEGSGRATLARLLGGVEPGAAIRIKGRTARSRSPRAALKRRLAYAPPDRPGQAIIPLFSVRESVTQASLPLLTRHPLIPRRKERVRADRFATALGVKAPDPRRPITTLSGGNQQKVVLARLLSSEAQVIVCDEPTAGVDLGARAEIYTHLCQLAAAGMSIVLSSSDMLELLGICHRIVVIREGEISAEFQAEEATEGALNAAQLPRRDAAGPLAAP
jgi:ABC-type sugar transport system ATPase subunit